MHGERLLLNTWSAQELASRYHCDTCSTPWLEMTEGVRYELRIPRQFHVERDAQGQRSN